MKNNSVIQTIHCFGDSLTAGYGAPPPCGWVSLLARRFPSLSFQNHGVCGSLLSDVLASALAAADTAEGAPFFLMGGTNDLLCGFRLDALCRTMENGARALSRRVPLALGVPLLTTRASIAAGWQAEWQYERTNEDLARYGEFLRALGAELLLPVLDFQKTFPRDDTFYADGVHPNTDGYVRMANVAAIWAASFLS